MKPGLKKGIFRIWIVLSLCWIGLVVTTGYGDLPSRDSPTLDAIAAKYGGKPVAEAGPWKDYQKPTSDATAAPTVSPETKVISPPAGYTPDPEGYVPYARPKRSEFIRDRSEIALIPPAVTYFFGFVVSPWILAGFRGRGQGNPPVK